MADNGKLTGMTRISGLDRANDLFEVTDVSLAGTKSATVNDMLGVTGAPLGNTDTQTVSNKTIGITNTITALDSTFSIVDNVDNTKIAQFQASGITTGTTRTYTLPNVSDTLVALTATQTLTNKTLTSPTINTPTINNPTLNTDTISEFTVNNGVTVGGVKLKAGALATNNSVITTNITDGNVTPAKLVTGAGTGWAWQTTWTPTWSGLSVGNGTAVYHYAQTGKTVTGSITLLFGTTSAVSGDVTFTLPVTAVSVFAANLKPIGQAIFYDGTTNIDLGYLTLGSTTTANIRAIGTASTYAGFAILSATIPITWGNNSSISVYFMYEAA